MNTVKYGDIEITFNINTVRFKSKSDATCIFVDWDEDMGASVDIEGRIFCVGTEDNENFYEVIVTEQLPGEHGKIYHPICTSRVYYN